jgi:hypothetical protein
MKLPVGVLLFLCLAAYVRSCLFAVKPTGHFFTKRWQNIRFLEG